MALRLLGGDSDLPTAINDMNTNLLELLGQQSTQIFRDDQGVRRVLLGKGADGFYGLKVSKEGYDVYDSLNANLIFNSSANAFIIIDSGTTSFTVTAAVSSSISGTGSSNVNHNQSERPLVIAFADVLGAFGEPDGSFMLPRYFVGHHSSVTSAEVITGHIAYRVTDTQIQFFGTNPSSSNPYTVNVKYFMMQETAE